MKKYIIFALIISILTCFIPTTLAEGETTSVEIYVSPSGSDSGAGTVSSPFATLERAKDEVRKLNKNMSTDIEVILRDGRYQLDETLEFTIEDSGSNGHKVIYKAYPGETPVISGGEQLTDWELYDKSKNIYRVDYDGPYSRQLFVNGERAKRAGGAKGQLPNMELTTGGYKLSSPHDIQTWRNPSDIDFFFAQTWRIASIPIKAIEGDFINLGDEFKNHQGKYVADGGGLSWIEHVFELLDEEGEWYFDREEQAVYYKPRTGENMETVKAYIPTLEYLVTMTGTETETVKDITFDGLTFSHATWLGPSTEYGFPQMQAGLTIDFRRYDERYIIGNLQLKYTENIEFLRSEFSHLGGVGIYMTFGATNNRVEGCEFFDINSSAVNLGVPLEGEPAAHDELRNNKIKNNYIHHVGVEHQGSAAIFTAYTIETEITHNELCHLPYSGISTGWGWGANKDSKKSRDNLIAYNHVWDVMTELADGGCIYNLDSQPGTKIINNHVHDIVSDHANTFYLDDGSRFITVENNIGYNANIALSTKGDSNVISNNFFDECLDTTLYGDQRVQGNNTKENNVVIKDGNFPMDIIAEAGIEYEWQGKMIKSKEGDNIFIGADGRMLDADNKIVKPATGKAAENALDGNSATIARPATTKAWTYTAILDSHRKLKDLTIEFEDALVPEKFNVKISTDGKEWETVHTNETALEGNSITIPCDNKIARLVSIELVSGKMGIKEISATAVDFLAEETEEEENVKLVTFYDINGHWGKEAIEYCASRGYVNGNDYGMYLPDDKVTRAEFAAMLLRTRDDMQKIHYDGRFLDIPDNAWYADYIIPMTNSKIFADEMITGGYIKPTEYLTRDEVAYMITMITGVELKADTTAPFADNADAAVWSVPYINTAKEYGFITGMDDVNYSPKSTLTRAEAATVIMRTLTTKIVEEEPVEETPTEDETPSEPVEGTETTDTTEPAAETEEATEEATNIAE